MGFLAVRISAVSTYLVERARHGVPEVSGPLGEQLLMVIDGVGGFQYAPVIVRRALRQPPDRPGGEEPPPAIALYRWHFGLAGEIWTDLMWLRRNRVMGAKLARKLLAYQRMYPKPKIHLIAFSGGAGIAVFACEALRGRRVIETLVLACPALSPGYNLAPALRTVERCIALISRRDRWILGLGTRLLGTTDRRFSASAGLTGFRIPADASPSDRQAYDRMREIHWDPDLLAQGHGGGHTSWATVRFLRRHLQPILRGAPLLPTRCVQGSKTPRKAG